MMTDGNHGAGDGFDPQDDEALWQLLGQQAPPKPVSPYFSRRVLREAALADDAHRDAGWWSRLVAALPWKPRQLAQWSGALALAVFCLTATLAPLHRPAARLSLTPQAVTPPATRLVVPTDVAMAPDVVREGAAPDDSVFAQDVEVIADLDNILQREESRLWTEEDTAVY